MDLGVDMDTYTKYKICLDIMYEWLYVLSNT